VTAVRLGVVCSALTALALSGEEKTGVAEKPSFKLSYVLTVDPEKKAVSVAGKLEGPGAGAVRRFSNPGIRGELKMRVSAGQDSLGFDYQLPNVQTAYARIDQPVLEAGFFAGFGDKLFLVPEAEGVRGCKGISLRLAFPEGWKVATSLGAEARELACPGLQDLLGTLICGGDYAVQTCDIPHRDPAKKTTLVVAFRGERKIDDARFVADVRQLVAAQMAYFGGSHPARRQFLALHFVPPGRQFPIPAFNRRTPAQDTILAMHHTSRPQDDFEFLGMLAHEHLHNWYPNVMRSDLGAWFMEGLNDYVAYRGLHAAGIHSAGQFAGMLSKWHREYHWCVERKDRRLMPYRRGMFAGLVFDLELRRASAGKAGLRDLLLGMLQTKPADGVVSRDDFLAMAQKLTGKDFAPLYQELVEADKAIDIPRFVEGSGFRLGDDKVALRLDPRSEPEKAFLKRLLSDE